MLYPVPNERVIVYSWCYHILYLLCGLISSREPWNRTTPDSATDCCATTTPFLGTPHQ
uniref:Uncharacterized protein n=1 Tax=uncultured marine virus TaxID=186617 RepID=A0A0F7L7J6_9VIRU|nr:hypothetical protein [uncultured marine virus]